MRPNDDPSLNVPSSPPPDQLPRPRVQRMSDIRPAGKQPPLQPPKKLMRPMSDFAPRQAPPVSKPPLTSLEEAAATPVKISPPTPPKKQSKIKWLLIGLGIFLALITAAVAGAFFWYQQQLAPVSSSTDHVRVIIPTGSTPSTIAKELKSKGLIRDEFAFSIYVQLSKTRADLKAGTYNLQPSESLAQIVNHLVSGKQDEFSLTFLPGDTLANHRKRLINAGYGAQEVDAALAKTYSRPLFASKPASADLEGYIYGETYRFSASATVEDILNKTFDQFEQVIAANSLEAGFQKQGLTLYQGITLASIIQREVSVPQDQKQVAQVFYSRMKAGMTLGSDVTYQYAADKMGVARDPGLDSPYNTRKFVGLPPGPISSPGLSALQAVAGPASGDYIYFLSGDDNKTYFGRTNAEHEQNIVLHCQKKCSIL